MGRPLYSTQARISALPQKKLENIDVSEEFGETTLAVGQTAYLIFSAIENFIYNIDLMYLYYLGALKKASDLGATSGFIYVEYKKSGITFASANYPYNVAPKFTTGQFGSGASSINPSDVNLMHKIVYGKTFDSNNNLQITIKNSTDVPITFTPYGQIQFVKEATS